LPQPILLRWVDGEFVGITIDERQCQTQPVALCSGEIIKGARMQTTSETILIIIVWALTCCGLFFGTRARLRKRRIAKAKAEVEPTPGDTNQAT